MKRAYSVSSYAKLYEKYCKENLPSEADGIFKRADEYYTTNGWFWYRFTVNFSGGNKI